MSVREQADCRLAEELALARGLHRANPSGTLNNVELSRGEFTAIAVIWHAGCFAVMLRGPARPFFWRIRSGFLIILLVIGQVLTNHSIEMA